MQRARETLALVLLTVLPFHAFLVTVGTRHIGGPKLAPLQELVVWKEVVLGVILLLAVAEIVRGVWKRAAGSGQRAVDAIDVAIIIFVALGIIVSWMNAVPLKQALYGAKYDLVPLIAFLILRRVPWSDAWKAKLWRWLPIIACIVVVYGLVALFLPQSYFTALGYSDLHSLYSGTGPLAPFQQLMVTSWRRMQSVMSGPNQMGIWLMLPFAIVMLGMMKEKRIAGSGQRSAVSMQRAAFFLLIALGILLAFSRAAWIGAAVIFFIAAWNNKRIVRTTAAAILLMIVGLWVLSPHTILRITSSKAHVEYPLRAAYIAIANPLGFGLGSAGPASNRLSDSCVFLGPNDDPSWAKPHSDLCVFVAGKQVQPAHPCHCPLLTENWYLQIAVELGIAGMAAFIALMALVLLRTLRSNDQFVYGTGLAVLGVSIAGLFLHAWEDSAVAYTVWVLLAAALSRATLNGRVSA